MRTSACFLSSADGAQVHGRGSCALASLHGGHRVTRSSACLGIRGRRGWGPEAGDARPVVVCLRLCCQGCLQPATGCKSAHCSRPRPCLALPRAGHQHSDDAAGCQGLTKHLQACCSWRAGASRLVGLCQIGLQHLDEQEKGCLLPAVTNASLSRWHLQHLPPDVPSGPVSLSLVGRCVTAGCPLPGGATKHSRPSPGGQQLGVAGGKAHDALVGGAEGRPDGDALAGGALHRGADVLQRPHQRPLPVPVRKRRQPAARQAQRLRV